MNRNATFSTKGDNTWEKQETLKSNIVFLITISVTLITFSAIVTSIFLQDPNLTIAVQAAAALAMVAGLVILARGNARNAVHIILIAGFSSLWIILFLDSSPSLLTKLCSMVLIVGLFSSMSIAFFKSRKPIVVYFIINSVLFAIFSYHLLITGRLHPDLLLEYSFYNAVALVFVFVVSFSAFTINQESLSSLKRELAERKKAEKEAIESKNLLSDHLKNTPVGAIFWDLNFRVTEWNPAAESIFGYTKEEALGKHPSELILPEDMKAQVNKVFEDLLTERGGIRNVNENTTKEGHRILCDWYNTLLKNSSGEIIGSVSLVNDITEKTQVNELLIQSEKMMSVGGLAAGMAHEINNPLSGMVQYAYITRNKLTTDLPDNIKTAQELGISMEAIRSYAEKQGVLQNLANIREAGNRVAKIIENMLSFSRKSDTSRQPLDLKALLEQTMELAGHDYDLKKKYNFKTIEIVRDYDQSIPEVYGEKSKIQQVFLNLFKNATYAMNMKTYENDFPKLNLRIETGERYVHILVEDNGPGIPRETCRHIFEPFFTTKKDKGTGLGLSISYSIITEDHGGQMEVETEPGKGTRFIIKLPFRQKGRGTAQNARIEGTGVA